MPPNSAPPASDVYVMHGAGFEHTVTRVAATTGDLNVLGQGEWREFTVDGAGHLFVATDHNLLRIIPATKVGDVAVRNPELAERVRNAAAPERQ